MVYLDIIDNNLRVNIKDKRIQMGLSKRKLHLMTGISRSSISSIELGKSMPTAITLYKLSRVFNCKIDDLIEVI